MVDALPDIWLTPQEIAEAGLPSLPSSKRGVASLGARENWQARQGLARRRRGVGGGWEYHVAVLPVEAQRAMVARHAAPAFSEGAAHRLAVLETFEALWSSSSLSKSQSVAEVARKHDITPATLWRWIAVVATVPRDERLSALSGAGDDTSVPVSEDSEARLDALPASVTQLKDYQREIMGARLSLLDRLETFASAVEFIVETDCNAELRALVETAGARGGSLSIRTIARWKKMRREGGDIALAPIPSRKAKAERPAWADEFMSFYARPSKPSISWCYEQMVALTPSGAPTPSLRSVTRWVKSLGEVERNRGRMGPRELKSLRAHVVRDTAGLMPADVYTADGHTLDMEVLHPATGRPFRPEVSSVLDVASRVCVGWSIALAESTFAVADAFRMSYLRSVPAIVYVDNGSGYKNAFLDANVTGVLARAGTTKTHSLPYNSQARGIIERFNGTCWVREARGHRGYVGHDMDREARQKTFKLSRGDGPSPLMDWAEFMDWAEATVARYNARPHTGLPKIVDPETGKRRHMSPDEFWQMKIGDGFEPVLLDEDTTLDLWRPYQMRQVRRGTVQINGASYFSQALDLGDYHGAQVKVGYDIHDPSRVWVRDMDDRLICVAELDANKTDYMPKSMVEKARDTREAAQIKRLDRKKADKIAETRGGLEYVPVESVDVPLPLASEVALARLSGNASGEAGVFKLPSDPEAKFRLWKEIEARRDAGEPLSEREENFHRLFQQSADFKVAVRLEKRRGPAKEASGDFHQ